MIHFYKYFNFLLGIHKEDKQKIKQLLHHFLADLYFVQRGELSDDEGDKDDDMETEEMEGQKEEKKDRMAAGRPDKQTEQTSEKNDKSDKENKEPNDSKDDIKKIEKSSKEMSPAINGVLSDSEKERESTDVSLFYNT